MKKIIAGVVATGAVLSLVGFAFQANSLVKNWGAKLAGSDGVSVKIQSQKIGEAKSAYSLALAKPDKARLETPSSILVSDGTTITTYFKWQKTYTKSAYSADKLGAALAAQEFSFFRAHLDPKAFDGFSGFKSAGTMSRRGQELSIVQFNMGTATGAVAKAYFASNGTPAQLELSEKAGSTVMNFEEIALGAPNANLFNFTPPEGSKEVSEAELMSAKWYRSVSEALAVAKSTNRMLFLDFYFDG